MNVYIGNKHNFILIETNDIIFLFINTIFFRTQDFYYLETHFITLVSFSLSLIMPRGILHYLILIDNKGNNSPLMSNVLFNITYLEDCSP